MCFSSNTANNGIQPPMNTGSVHISTENLKQELKRYSSYLRRDFLAVIVKLSGKMFGMHLTRTDWRTRTGMLNFISKNWEILSEAIRNPTNTMGWYAANFEFIEKILNDRKFSVFLYTIWHQYSAFLMDHETVRFMHMHMQEISTAISSKDEVANFSFENCETGRKVADIILKFKGRKRETHPVAPAPVVQQPQSTPVSLDPYPINFGLVDTIFAENEEYNFDTFDCCDEMVF